MVSLITKTDIEAELQTTLAASYTDNIMTAICDWAHSQLRRKTNRTSFSGDAAADAKLAEIYLAIDRMTTANRDLINLGVASISENGASITYTSNQKTLLQYRQDAQAIIADLKLNTTSYPSIQMPDPLDAHTGDEGSVLY